MGTKTEQSSNLISKETSFTRCLFVIFRKVNLKSNGKRRTIEMK